MANLSREELHQAQEAHATLVREIFVPVFLEKLANDYGIVPQNDQEVSSLLEIAGRLGEAAAHENVKAASVQTSFLDVANRSLGGVMGQKTQDHNLSNQIKQASNNLAQRPDIIDAVLTYHGAIVKSAEEGYEVHRPAQFKNNDEEQAYARMLNDNRPNPNKNEHVGRGAAIGAGVGALAGGAGKYLLGDKKKSGLRNFTEGALGGAALGAGAGALYGRSQGKDYAPLKDPRDYKKNPMTSEEFQTRARAGDALTARAKAEKAEAAEKKNTPPKDEDPKPKEAARNWYDGPPAGQMSRDERYRQQALANGGK
jgi:hypothetical protein